MSKRSTAVKRKAVSDAEQKAKRARGETELGDGLRWTAAGKDQTGACPALLCLTSDSLDGRQKVAGFDIDFTVIKTASGRTFATGSNDWVYWDDKVPERLKDLHKNGHRIVFFTNQAGIEKNKTSPDVFKVKVEAIIQDLGIPVLVFVSTGVNYYRKPYTTMWDYFVKHCNQGVKVNMSDSVYVGDAAGRAKNWAAGKPKDFSCSDRMFAANIGVKFATPEEFFLGEKAAAFQWGSIDPNKFLANNPVKKLDSKSYAQKAQHMVLLIGPPASGKSTFSRRHFKPHGYVIVNRDTLGTKEKCVKVAKEAIKKGSSVVVDNTNPSKSAREEFIHLAKEHGLTCTCIVMDTPLELAHHLNLYRQKQTQGEVRRVPDVGYNVYKKNFEEPDLSEGLAQIIKVPFKPQFDSASEEALFKQWTV